MQVTFYPVVIVLLFALAVSLIIFANMLFYTMLGEVNGTLPPDKQVGMLGVNTKYGRILKLHAQFFPNSNKRERLKVLWISGFFFAAIAFAVDIIHYGR
jgi:hypothetical protein